MIIREAANCTSQRTLNVGLCSSAVRTRAVGGGSHQMIAYYNKTCVKESRSEFSNGGIGNE